MTFPFAWNEFADQPHNVAPRRERFWHHFRHAGTYLDLVASSIALSVPALRRYRCYIKSMHKQQVSIGHPFAVSCSSAGERDERVIEALKAAGIRQTLVRLPSWGRDELPRYERFIRLLRGEGMEVAAALLQRREDVLNPASWEGFLGDVFSGFSPLCSFFEVGHAWNRTKWGVWNYREYLDLACRAMPLAKKYAAKLIGPAVIDFEFHLYPLTIKDIPFDKVSSLLYVDRTGAPENAQFGWTTAEKVALWKAVVEASLRQPKDCWITEVNWPLRGTGKYSPAPGKPAVTEEEQASYLVRYYIICLASGLVERIYWWQLAAPGYGLIDNREETWRRRPSFFALKTLAGLVEGSRFIGKAEDSRAEVFFFRKEEHDFAVCWTRKGTVEHAFREPVKLIVGRDGEEKIPVTAIIRVEERPQYVFFR